MDYLYLHPTEESNYVNLARRNGKLERIGKCKEQGKETMSQK